MLGQVNLSTATATPISIPTGNEMEDAFEAVALGINNIMRVASATRFPGPLLRADQHLQDVLSGSSPDRTSPRKHDTYLAFLTRD